MAKRVSTWARSNESVETSADGAVFVQRLVGGFLRMPTSIRQQVRTDLSQRE